MIFTATAWVVTSSFAFRATAQTLVQTGSLQSLMVSLSDGPWGEPLLTDESCPLRSRMWPGNYSSTPSINQSDVKVVRPLFKRLLQTMSPDFDEKPTVFVKAAGDIVGDISVDESTAIVRALRPVVFSLRQSNGGRIVRPESVVELNDNDVDKSATGIQSVAVSDNCQKKCTGNSAECSLLTAVCSLQAHRTCVGARCRRHLGTNTFKAVKAES